MRDLLPTRPPCQGRAVLPFLSTPYSPLLSSPQFYFLASLPLFLHKRTLNSRSLIGESYLLTNRELLKSVSLPHPSPSRPPALGLSSLRILPFNLSSPALSTSRPSGPFQELSSSPQGPSCPCQDSHLPGPFFSLQNLILGFLLASAGTFISLRFSSAFPGLSPPASPLQRSPLLSQSPSSPGAWLFETPAPAAPPV